MRDCCNSCDDGHGIEQHYRSLMNVERCVSFLLGMLVGVPLAGIIVAWLFVTYLR